MTPYYRSERTIEDVLSKCNSVAELPQVRRGEQWVEKAWRNQSASRDFFFGRAEAMPEVLQCYRVTGSDSLIMKVMAASVEHLESLIDQLSAHGQLTTSMVLSTPVKRRIVSPVAETA